MGFTWFKGLFCRHFVVLVHSGNAPAQCQSSDSPISMHSARASLHRHWTTCKCLRKAVGTHGTGSITNITNINSNLGERCDLHDACGSVTSSHLSSYDQVLCLHIYGSDLPQGTRPSIDLKWFPSWCPTSTKDPKPTTGLS